MKKGTTGDYLVHQEWPKAKRRSFDDVEKAAQALLKKKIALFVSDAQVVWWLAGRHEAAGVELRLAAGPLAAGRNP